MEKKQSCLEEESNMSLLWIRAGIIAAVLPMVLLSSPAFAKRAQRDGLNFGTTLSYSNVSQPSLIMHGEEATAKGQSLSKASHPYIGYTFGEFFTLGLQGAMIAEERMEKQQGAGNSLVTNERSSVLQGGGLFTRFLFGQVMYFEAGIGYFERRSSLVSKSVSYLSAGGFEGVEETIRARSSGIGYRIAVGLEIPVAYDFYATSSYASNKFDLKGVKVTPGNEKGSFEESQQQIEFGIAYYYN
jgi:hypothetical protein